MLLPSPNALVRQALTDLDIEDVESFTLPGRASQTVSIPEYLSLSPVGDYLKRERPTLWRHQGRALELVGEGKNIVVSTGTASGKSLIFKMAALHRVLVDDQVRVIVLYPLKALAADQMIGWKLEAERLGLPESAVVRIDGGVPMPEREALLDSGRIVIMTPDVCHAWLMAELAKPAVRRFIGHLGLVVLDEAHTLEGVMGSNFAFLMRRLCVAQATLAAEFKRRCPIQVIAATATIQNAVEHLESLTGKRYAEIGEQDDGSPQHERLCIHVSSDAKSQLVFSRLIRQLASTLQEGAILGFMDSRKGVEQAAEYANKSDKDNSGSRVYPYRSGYEPEDRSRIERGLKNGSIRGVVSTSALELGVDIPQLVVGLTCGIPATRKAYRQRLGRIGRSGPGVFLVVENRLGFKKFGSSFREYHDESVEPSHLYTDNRFIQFAHARCLMDEMEVLGINKTTALKSRLQWPDGFSDVLEQVLPGGSRGREFDAMAELGGDSPHRSYPLRNVGELNLKIALTRDSIPMGDVTLSQAIRECYPGATYLHMARRFRVTVWENSRFNPLILVSPAPKSGSTQPTIQTWVNAAVVGTSVLEGHFRSGPTGFMAECEMEITERVVGFRDAANNVHEYAKLRESKPSMKSRSRRFRTTGVLFQIEVEDRLPGGLKSAIRHLLVDFAAREYSIAPQDIGSASTNISVQDGSGTQKRSDCIAVFDQTYGSLRLTERLFTDFDRLLGRIHKALDSVDQDALEDATEALHVLQRFSGGLSEQTSLSTELDSLDEDEVWMQVYSTGSVVGWRDKGPMHTEVVIREPAYDRSGQFGYRVECRQRPGTSPMTRWVSNGFLDPIGDDWSYQYWNPDTGEVRETDAAS